MPDLARISPAGHAGPFRVLAPLRLRYGMRSEFKRVARTITLPISASSQDRLQHRCGYY